WARSVLPEGGRAAPADVHDAGVSGSGRGTAFAGRPLGDRRNLARSDEFDAGEYLGPQVAGDVVVPAAPLDQFLHRLLQPVLLQARVAFAEMLLELVAFCIGHLAVEILIEVVKYLGAVRLVRFAAAHVSEPFRSCSP